VRQGVREPPVQLGIGIPDDGAVVQVDFPVAVEVGDLVLARRTVGGVRQVALVADLPQAVRLKAVDRAEWLPDPDDVGLPAFDKTAAPNAREDLRDTSQVEDLVDRKSTRLNSSHVKISYAVFCLK